MNTMSITRVRIGVATIIFLCTLSLLSVSAHHAHAEEILHDVLPDITDVTADTLTIVQERLTGETLLAQASSEQALITSLLAQLQQLILLYNQLRAGYNIGNGTISSIVEPSGAVKFPRGGEDFPWAKGVSDVTESFVVKWSSETFSSTADVAVVLIHESRDVECTLGTVGASQGELMVTNVMIDKCSMDPAGRGSAANPIVNTGFTIQLESDGIIDTDISLESGTFSLIDTKRADNSFVFNGTNDPGLGYNWQTSLRGTTVFVTDRSLYTNRGYFPGCVTNSWHELGFRHSLSLQYNRTGENGLSPSVNNSCRGQGSLHGGYIYSQRMPLGTADQREDYKGSFGTIALAPAESGETGGQAYDIAISTVPGELNPTEFPNDRCKAKGVINQQLSLMSRNVWETLSPRLQGAYCPVKENTVYYFNFTPSSGTRGATECGKNGYICRMQVLTSQLSSYFQDVRVGTESVIRVNNPEPGGWTVWDMREKDTFRVTWFTSNVKYTGDVDVRLLQGGRDIQCSLGTADVSDGEITVSRATLERCMSSATSDTTTGFQIRLEGEEGHGSLTTGPEFSIVRSENGGSSNNTSADTATYTFNGNNASPYFLKTASGAVGSPLLVPVPNPSKPNAVFAGWYPTVPSTMPAVGGESFALWNCIAPWGAVITYNRSVDAYSVSSHANCSTAGLKETRTCTNGVLSGSFTNQSCSTTGQ